MAFAGDNFIVSPYILVNENNNLLLNFQPSKDVKLNIEIKRFNKKIGSTAVKNFNSLYKTDLLTKLEIGKLNCDEVINYKITSLFKATNIDQGLYSIPCDKKEPLYLGFLSDTQIKNSDGQKRADELSATVADLKKVFKFLIGSRKTM